MRIKINWNFYIHISLWCLKILIKTFLGIIEFEQVLLRSGVFIANVIVDCRPTTHNKNFSKAPLSAKPYGRFYLWLLN